MYDFFFYPSSYNNFFFQFKKKKKFVYSGQLALLRVILSILNPIKKKVFLCV